MSQTDVDAVWAQLRELQQGLQRTRGWTTQMRIKAAQIALAIGVTKPDVYDMVESENHEITVETLRSLLNEPISERWEEIPDGWMDGTGSRD